MKNTTKIISTLCGILVLTMNASISNANELIDGSGGSFKPGNSGRQEASAACIADLKHDMYVDCKYPNYPGPISTPVCYYSPASGRNPTGGWTCTCSFTCFDGKPNPLPIGVVQCILFNAACVL